MVSHILVEILRRMPFVRVFLCYSFGILSGFHANLAEREVCILRGLIMMALGIAICSTMLRPKIQVKIFPVVFYLTLFMTGMYAISCELPAAKPDDISRSAASIVIGIIEDQPIVTETAVRFPVKVVQGFVADTTVTVSGRVMVSIGRVDHLDSLAYGDKIALKNDFKAIPDAFNPNQFNYKRYCASKNIHYQAYLKADAFQLLERRQSNPLVGIALTLRQQLVDKFQGVIKDSKAFAVCTALVLGYRGNLDADMLRSFSDTGTIHVLSVSGLHVGIVFYVLSILCRFLERLRYGRSIRFVFIFAAIWAYVMLTGMSPSILRAGMMVSFLLLSHWSDRRYGNLNTLFAAASVQLLFAPFMLFDVGFQLSYCAVYGLFTLYPLLRRAITFKPVWLSSCYKFLCVSVSAQLFTAPLALYYFHQFPTYFLLGNTLISLPATLLMYLGLLLALSPFPMLDLFLGRCMVWISNLVLAGLAAIQQLPHAVIQGLHVSTLQMCVFASLLLAILLAWHTRWKFALLAAAVLVLLFTVMVVKNKIDIDFFCGIKIYNMQHDIAIAVIDRREVALFSSFDSVGHPRLMAGVWPDLSRYTTIDRIHFEGIIPEKGRSFYINTHMGRLLLVDQLLHPSLTDSADWIVWHGARKQDSISLAYLHANNYLIIDGSNHINSISRMIHEAEYLGVPYYVLKDNFAYVWKKPD